MVFVILRPMRGFLYLLFLLAQFTALTPVQAADTHTVAPLAFNLNVEKRDIIEDIITLTNLTDHQLRLYATVNEVAVDGNGVVESFREPSMVDRTNSPTAWVEINRGRIELAPGEVRQLPFTIRMNPNTAPGDYSVFIGFASGSNQPAAQAAVMAGQAPGTLVNLVVDKKQDQFLRIERFRVDRFVTGRGASVATFTLVNPGFVDVIPSGELMVYDTTGNEVAAIPINTEAVATAREKSQTYTVALPTTLAIGKYKAYLSVEYGEHGTQGVQDTAYFYVLPFVQIIIAFLVVSVLAVGLTLYLHRRFDRDDDFGADPVAMYRREGKSDEKHHDLTVPSGRLPQQPDLIDKSTSV